MPNVTVSVVVRDLTEADLDALGWSGAASHLVAVREQLRRVESCEVEYLVAAASSGHPIGKLGIDYTQHAGAGTIYQAAVPSWVSNRTIPVPEPSTNASDTLRTATHRNSGMPKGRPARSFGTARCAR